MSRRELAALSRKRKDMTKEIDVTKVQEALATELGKAQASITKASMHARKLGAKSPVQPRVLERANLDVLDALVRMQRARQEHDAPLTNGADGPKQQPLME